LDYQYNIVNRLSYKSIRLCSWIYKGF